MTEDSRGRMRGYGPFEEGAEPTAPIPAQGPAQPPPQPGPPPLGGVPAQPGPPGGVPTQPGAMPPGGVPAQPGAVPRGGVPDQPDAVPPGGVSARPGAMPSSGNADDWASEEGWVSAPTPQPPAPSDPYAPDPYPPYGPFHNADPHPADSYGLATSSGRRIEPTPPPTRSRFVPGVLAGLLAGLLLFGAGGFLLGRLLTSPDSPSEPPATPSLGVFEQTQQRINAADFANTGLVPIAQGWLPFLSTCSRVTPQGGGEKNRVRCTLDGVTMIFVEYGSTTDRDRARARSVGQAEDVANLTPGAAPAEDNRATPSGRTSGNYTEYAYRLTEGGVTRTVSGIWWDDADTPVAGYLLAYWRESAGEDWASVRDLWSRYA